MDFSHLSSIFNTALKSLKNRLYQDIPWGSVEMFEMFCRCKQTPDIETVVEILSDFEPSTLINDQQILLFHLSFNNSFRQNFCSLTRVAVVYPRYNN